LFERLLFHFSSRTNSKQLLPRAEKPHSLTAVKIVSITCTRLLTVGMHHIAIAVMSHPYTVCTRGSCQAVSPMAWEWG